MTTPQVLRQNFGPSSAPFAGARAENNLAAGVQSGFGVAGYNGRIPARDGNMVTSESNSPERLPPLAAAFEQHLAKTYKKQVAAMNITQARLKELLDYDPVTGVFTWKVSRGGVRPGASAGAANAESYVLITVDDVGYYAHHLAWLFIHGTWPTDEINHWNSDRGNNCISNLRRATRSQIGANAQRGKNNTSGYKGVSWDKSRQLWRAQIKVKRRGIFLGRFKLKEQAAAAYLTAAEKHFGQFARAA